MVKLAYLISTLAIIDEARDAAHEPMSVLLLVAILALAAVIVVQDSRAKGNLKAVLKHYDDFAKVVKEEREKREKERASEHAQMIQIVEKNTEAVTSFRVALDIFTARTK